MQAWWYRSGDLVNIRHFEYFWNFFFLFCFLQREYKMKEDGRLLWGALPISLILFSRMFQFTVVLHHLFLTQFFVWMYIYNQVFFVNYKILWRGRKNWNNFNKKKLKWKMSPLQQIKYNTTHFHLHIFFSYIHTQTLVENDCSFSYYRHLTNIGSCWSWVQ